MPVQKWKFIKSLFYALLIAFLAAFAVASEADPTAVYLAAVFGFLIVFGVEVKEVEIAQLITITFQNERKDEEER